MDIPIKGLDRAALLAALYNRARPLGMGYLNFRPGDMSIEEARELLADGQRTGIRRSATYFDYVHGRVMKVELGGDTLDPWLYDRDNGSGAAAQVVAWLRQETG